MDSANELVVRIHPENVCVVCEHKIEARRKMIIKSGVTYCSKGCASYKPPQIIRLEQKLKLPIECVLEVCTQRWANVKSMCAALGIGPSVYVDWCTRYCVEIPQSKLSK